MPAAARDEEPVPGWVGEESLGEEPPAAFGVERICAVAAFAMSGEGEREGFVYVLPVIEEAKGYPARPRAEVRTCGRDVPVLTFHVHSGGRGGGGG